MDSINRGQVAIVCWEEVRMIVSFSLVSLSKQCLCFEHFLLFRFLFFRKNETKKRGDSVCVCQSVSSQLASLKVGGFFFLLANGIKVRKREDSEENEKKNRWRMKKDERRREKKKQIHC